MSEKLTIQKFAEKLGVSVATVSRALNAETKHKVAADTLQVIEEGAKKYGYTPNLSAKNLRNNTYKTLGIVFVHHEGLLSSEYYSHLLSGFSDGCLKVGYRIKMLLLEPEKGPWDAYDFKSGEGIDGLVITYWRSIFSKESTFKKLDIPSIVINNVEEGVPAKFIAADHIEGGRLIAEHLYQKGHKKIAIVGGKRGGADAQEKLGAFYDYFKKQGIQKNNFPFYEVDFKESKTRERAKEILSTPDITAIFCMDDCQAIALLEEMKTKSERKISVIGHGNEMRGLMTKPKLTTVRAPVYELGYEAALDLADYLKTKDKDQFFETKRFPVEFIERESVYEIQ